MALFAQTEVPIVTGSSAGSIELYAAEELSAHLAALYPKYRFPITHAAPAKGPVVWLGTPRTMPELGKHVAASVLATPDSFVVKTRQGEAAFIAGADERGALYAVYALLEKLGFGFYLSYTAKPEARAGAFTFEGWDLQDTPLFPDRLVFDWHNFLSSCSTWEWEDWESYVNQASRMRYSAIMVHAYGNNPMFRFSFNGQTKPVGYLATSVRGRDWGTEHVNDVRRLHGGELFHAPIFAASHALGLTEDERAEAKIALMKRVFRLARIRGLGVTYAHDVDTESSNPQNILLTLPASARITSGKFQLANPETPEGYAYYKEQVRQLLATYPQIDRLAVWFRNNSTPWRNLEPKDFPEAWRKQFQAALDRHAPLRGDKEAHGMFVMSKLVRTFRRALDELGRTDVELAYGSWRFPFLRAADILMPAGTTAIPLDWQIVFDKPETQQYFRVITADGRKTIPIVWAHHDDHTYIGRPYTPFPNFASLLSNTGSRGFGIIHWTTRPLDIYFKSLARQVWQSTENEPLAITCERMAGRSFGTGAAGKGGAYLMDWVTEAPMFGRETSNRFIDQPLKDPDRMLAGFRRRLELLAGIDEKTLTPTGRTNRDYFRDYERFMLGFFESHIAFEKARKELKDGNTAAARTEIAAARPEDVIRRYVEASTRGKVSRGEQALVVSLNLRWLPYILSMRQALALEPARFKFQPTQDEALAQGAGTNTFYFDERQNLWRAFGEKETGAQSYDEKRGEEICRTGLRLEQPLTLKLGPTMGGSFLPGTYRVELLFARGDAASAQLEMQGQRHDLQVEQGTGEAQSFAWPVAIQQGALELTIRPRGSLRLCGAVIAPAH
jgi:hypothetical protein